MYDPVFPTAVLLVTLAGSMTLMLRAGKQLSIEQALSLAQSGSRIPWTLILIGMSWGLQTWLSHRLGHPLWLMAVFMFALLLMLAGFFLNDIRRFRKLGLPAGYIRVVVLTQLCTIAATGFFYWASFHDIQELNSQLEAALGK